MNKPLPSITERPEQLQMQLRAETDAKKRARLQALYLLASGQATSRLMLAKLLAVHRHTLQTWLKLYEAGGLKALLTINKAPGKTPSVSPYALTKLQEQLATMHGFGSYGEVQQYLARMHKVTLAYYYCVRNLALWQDSMIHCVCATSSQRTANIRRAI